MTRVKSLPLLALLALLALTGGIQSQNVPRTNELVPLVDHHQHLLSPATVQFLSAAGARSGRPVPRQDPVTAKQLITMLDAAGIQRAVVLSNAYYFDGPRRGGGGYPQVQAENDWTAEEVRSYPTRLIGFCSFSPIQDHALAELDRCVKTGAFKGVKLHFATSGVDLKNPEHVEKVRRVVAAANAYRFPIIIHVRATPDSQREHAEVLLNQLLPAAPDVPVQIAHLWGGAEFSEGALVTYADAVATHQPAATNLYFDVAEIASVIGNDQRTLRRAADLMRRIGIERILFGSDGPTFGNLQPREAWATFRKAMPLTPEEFTAIATNVAPYMR